MSCSTILLVCVVLLEFGPQGGGPVPCTCLMSNGTQSCQTNFGPRPNPVPDAINCGSQLCTATSPDPTCPINANTRWTNPGPPEHWVVELARFSPPPPEAKGHLREHVLSHTCTHKYYCSLCQENLQASPPGSYCLKQSFSDQYIQLYALCLDNGQMQECFGN